MFTEKQIEELVELLFELDPVTTKIYIGTDSVRFKNKGRWHARYATVCIVHKNGANGCRLFGVETVEPDFDVKKNRPSIRLMNEVQKSCALYVQLAPFIDEFDIAIHVDVNTDPKHGSSCVAQQAAGYVLGQTGMEPVLKPHAFAASFAADHIANNKLVRV